MRIVRSIALLASVPALACSGSGSNTAPLRANHPLHLEDHLDAATIEGSEVPEEIAAPIEWRFDEAGTGWRSVTHHDPEIKPLQLEHTEGALRVTLSEAQRDPRGDRLHGDIYIELPDLRRSDWSHILLRARTSDDVRRVQVGFNLREQPDTLPPWFDTWRFWGEDAVVVRDGAVHTYRLRADWSEPWQGEWEDPWRQLGVAIDAREPSSINIVSVTIVPKAAVYAEEPVGVRTEVRNDSHRRILYTHAPGRLSYRVRVPEGARLDVGLGVLAEDDSVTFRVTEETDGAEVETLLEETYADPEHWVQRSVDLSHLADETVTLSLEATAEEEGSVAMWAAPTLSGTSKPEQPNIIFYVIDGAGADLMSVYDYNRRTSPNLERIAAEGAVFDRAHTTSAWTKPSTASFMTSLHHSVLGGFRTLSDPIPEQAVTMAQHFHQAGYQTAVFTSNPNAGSLSDLQRGVDVFRDKGIENHSESSVQLHEDFWRWRDEFPGRPFWVHFQTTDVHEWQRPVPPFAGLYVTAARRDSFLTWVDRVWDFEEFDEDEWPETVLGFYQWRLEQMGIDPVLFFDTQRGLYDETMAHQDYQIGRLVERLQATGEWENTLLIIASDHGHPAGSFSRFGRGLVDPPPPEWEGTLLDSYRTRIPLIFVWPGRIAPGQRFREPVSMIDMLPTVLELAGLPLPEVMQGQSLAPLLLGRAGWEPQPVIIEQLQNDLDTGEFTGHIEVIDGRWGASLEIFPERAEGEPEVEPAGNWRAARPHREEVPRLLLYDLFEDPFTLQNVNDQYPDLVEKYTAFLEAQWEAHLALAQYFTQSGEVALTAEQLRTLRSLGYIQ